MSPTHFHVGASSYSRCVIKATAPRDDGDVFEILTWYPGVLPPTLCASHVSVPLVARVRSDRLWCPWMLWGCADGGLAGPQCVQGHPQGRHLPTVLMRRKSGSWNVFDTLAVAQGGAFAFGRAFEADLLLRQVQIQHVLIPGRQIPTPPRAMRKAFLPESPSSTWLTRRVLLWDTHSLVRLRHQNHLVLFWKIWHTSGFT